MISFSPLKDTERIQMSQSLKYSIDESVAAVKSKLNEILVNDIKKPYIKTSWNNNELIIQIEKMGSSEIRIQLTEVNGKCTIQESKRAISFMHKPFVGEVEKTVHDIFTNKLGARKV
jgi:hypothetical protein